MSLLAGKQLLKPLDISGSLTVTGSINVSGSVSASVFSGSGAGLFNIPAGSIVGLNLSQITSGSVSASISPNNGFQVNTNTSILGNLTLTGSIIFNSGSRITSTYYGNNYPGYIDIVAGAPGGFVELLSYNQSSSFVVEDYGVYITTNSSSLFNLWEFRNDGRLLAPRGIEAPSFTGSLFGTASWAYSSSVAISSSFATSASVAISSSYATTASYISGSVFTSTNPALSASYALTASYALFAANGGGSSVDTGSFVTTSSFNSFTSSYNTGSFTGSFTGSLFGTGSYANQALSSSYSQTASYAPAYLPLTGGTINGNVTVNGTASITFLNVQYETASVIYSSGSNQFGDAADDVQTLYGLVRIPTGNLSVTGSVNVTGGITGSFTGSVQGYVPNTATSSFVTNSQTSSFVQNSQTSSFVTNAQTSSMTVATASYVTGSIFTGTNTALSASYALTASFATTASYTTGSIFTSTNPALSSSYALTASYALNGGGGSGFPYTGVAAILGSLILTGSAASGSSIFVITGSVVQSQSLSNQVYGINITPTMVFNTGSQTNTTFRVTPTFSGSSAFTASQTNIVADFGAANVGTQFSVTDVTSGSIYTVNDISGLPIIEALSDWTVNMYNFPTTIFQKTGSAVNINGTLTVSGSTVITGSLRIQSGSNTPVGSAILVAGRALVNNNTVTATSTIFLTPQSGSGTQGFLSVGAKVAATSFAVSSSSTTDTSTFGYLIIN